MRRMFVVFLLIAAVPLTADIAPCPWMRSGNIFFDWRGETSGCTSLQPQECYYGEVITFTARSFNYQFSCGPHTFDWNFGDGTIATGPAAQHVYASAAVYNVTLTVANHKQALTVQDDVVLAIVERWPLVYQRVEARTYQFSVYGVGAGDWIWDFGDGIVVSGPGTEQTHSYATGGDYDVHVTSKGRPDLTYLIRVSVPYPRRRSAGR